MRVQEMRLNTAILPISFHNIIGNNNIVQFMEGPDVRTATIPPGIHSGDSLSDTLADAMTSAGTQPYTVETNPVTNKLTITAVNPFKLLYSSSAKRVIGLAGDSDTATSVTPHRPVDLSGCKLILISVGEITNSDVVYAQRENLNIVDIVAVSVDYGNVLVHSNHDSQYVNVRDQVLSAMTVDLLDGETLKPLDFNGETFQLVFDII